jgi:gliding motility-associatede transport system auxiliary component
MSPLSRRTYATSTILLAAITFVAVNIAASSLLTNVRLDLTENGQFTLARGTKNIIGDLKEPITLKFFFSKKVAADYAQTTAYANRVRDLLEEYKARAHGNIVLQEVDPEAYTPEEDEASAQGLTAAPTDSGEQVYFGLVGTNRIDGKETIAYFAPEREPFLEYDITSLIYRLETPKKPLIGIISSLPLDGGGGTAAALQGSQSRPNAIFQELGRSWSTQMLDTNFKQIPSGIGILLIVHPTALSNSQAYAIDQFVLGGGHALIFVDPNSEIAQASGGMEQGAAPPSSNLAPLFKAWGISYDPTKVIGDLALAQRVQVSSDPRNPVASYPVWLHLTRGAFAATDPVVANLQTLNLASAGALNPMRNAKTHFVPLVYSSDDANLLDASEVRLSTHPQDLMATIEPTGFRYTIAARVSGIVPSAFPNGPPVDSTPAAAGALPPAHSRPLRQSREPINLIVMADSDIFDDRFWVHVESVYGKEIAAPFADNAAFVLNAVENLIGSNDLISLRTRATNDRPFVVVRTLQAAAQAQFQQEAETLQQRLTDTQQRLHDLEQGGSTNGKPTDSTALTPQQQVAIERFQRRLVATREQLRGVQHNLRKAIDTLGSILAFINIALMPLVAAFLALVVAALRRRRRSRAVRR